MHSFWPIFSQDSSRFSFISRDLLGMNSFSVWYYLFCTFCFQFGYFDVGLGLPVYSRALVSKQYRKNWLWFDVACMLPVDLVCRIAFGISLFVDWINAWHLYVWLHFWCLYRKQFSGHSCSAFLRFNRLLRVARLISYHSHLRLQLYRSSRMCGNVSLCLLVTTV